MKRDKIIDNLKIHIVNRKSSFPDIFLYAKYLNEEVFKGTYYKNTTGNQKLDHVTRKYLEDELSKHSEIKKFEGKMIRYGNRSEVFSLWKVINWFIWYSHLYTLRKVKNALKRFLYIKYFNIIPALWIMGLNVETEIKLNDETSIVPVDVLPHSMDKESFSKYNNLHFGFLNRTPDAVLVHKNISVDRIDKDMIVNDDFKLANDNLLMISKFLNIFSNLIAVPYYITSYTEDDIPCGPYNGSGGGLGFFDVQPSKVVEVNKKDFNKDLSKLLNNFLKLNKKEKEKWIIVLDRLIYAKSKQRIEDKILDLVIALEMLLLEEADKQQLKLAFRLRGSWLIAKNKSERFELFQTLAKMYDFRSEIAHSGRFKKKSKRVEVEKEFDKYLIIVERICSKLILDGRKSREDWDEVILGK